MKLKGVHALITGSNQGFGLAVAQSYVSEGADVMLCARDSVKLEAARSQLQSIAPGDVRVRATPTDIVAPEQVEALVAATVRELGGLDVLVANAGVYGPKGGIDTVDWKEWVDAVTINLAGSVLCCRAVLPIMKAQRRGKIIVLSGGGATKPMPNLSAYATSKAGLVRFAETLAGEVQEFNIQVNSVAPGALNTRLLDEVIEAGPDKIGQKFFDEMVRVKQSGGTPLEMGAALCVYLASLESGLLSGRLISAVWDPWKDFGQHSSELQSGDVYTLRRIVPKDRGMNWGG